MYHPITRRIKNYFGSIKGYSGCLVCGDTWDWKEEHSIPYTEGRSAFPTCEECWQTKSDKEILKAVSELCEQWLVQSPAHYYEYTKECTILLMGAAEKAVASRKLKESV